MNSENLFPVRFQTSTGAPYSTICKRALFAGNSEKTNSKLREPQANANNELYKTGNIRLTISDFFLKYLASLF